MSAPTGLPRGAAAATTVPAEDFIVDAASDERFCVRGSGGSGHPAVSVYRGDANRVVIGDRVAFGDDVEIFVGANHRTDWVACYGLREMFGLPGAFEANPWSKGDVVIADDVVIGRGAKIFSGVTIGAGAVVRPYSIVSASVEAGAVVVGCPAGPEVDRAAVAGANPQEEEGRDGRATGDQVKPAARRSRLPFRSARLSRLLPRGGDRRATNLVMGRETYFRPIVHGDDGVVTIGNYSSISYDSEMLLEPAVPAGTVRSRPSSDRPAADRSADIDIGSDVWVARGAKVLGGVTIGHGAVAAAYSVVTSDVPPYAIAAGNPARIIGQRFHDDTIAALLRIEWWNWPHQLVIERSAELCSADVHGFVARYDPAPR